VIQPGRGAIILLCGETKGRSLRPAPHICYNDYLVYRCVKGGKMIRKTFSEEFESDGAEVVREKVARRAYVDDEKHAQAIKWLNEQDFARKTYKAVKKQLELARRTARETRLTLAVTVIILVVLGLVLAKLYAG
jgi:hypothetical protein